MPRGNINSSLHLNRAAQPLIIPALVNEVQAINRTVAEQEENAGVTRDFDPDLSS